MFTGIVTTGQVTGLDRLDSAARITVQHHFGELAQGESIAVNGVCLTVAGQQHGLGFGHIFAADIMAETLARSGVGQLQLGQRVNLERATTPTGLLGGHIVQGHVDGQAEVLAVRPSQHWTLLVLRLPHELAHYIAEKGSVALDGVSLTVVSVADRDVTVSLIPTTLRETTLGDASAGDKLNLEVDVLARYIECQLAASLGPSRYGPELSASSARAAPVNAPLLL